MSVLTPTETFFLLHISHMLNVSTFGNTADIYAIVHLVPHACQHITVDQSHSSGDTVAKILKSGDRGSHRINASSSCHVRIPKHKMTAQVS